jgi:hypothetical protein
MAKKDKQSETTENAQETAATPETEVAESKPEAPPEAAIEKAQSPSTEITSYFGKLADGNDKFITQYKDRIQMAEKDMPSPRQLQEIIDKLPEDLAENINGIFERLSPVRKGIYAADARLDMTELRLFQGTGTDASRPANCIPGQFYTTSKDNIGPVFEGIVVLIWQGRTMWGDKDDNNRVPVCQSMDRKMGSNYAECESCPHQPWRDGQKQQCSDDAGAFMLTKDLKELMLVRFSRTSEPAGRQLMKLVRKTRLPWMKTYKITTEEKKNEKDRYRWFELRTEVGEYTDEKLYDLCNALSSITDHDFILPNLAFTYKRAARIMSEVGGASGANVGVEKPDATKPAYGFDDETPPNV